MNYFECCQRCVAPKRYPGCSGKCPEYAQARSKYESDKAENEKDKCVRMYSIDVVRSIMDRKSKREKNHRGYRKF